MCEYCLIICAIFVYGLLLYDFVIVSKIIITYYKIPWDLNNITRLCISHMRAKLETEFVFKLKFKACRATYLFGKASL